jgi:hypothetical protein
MDERERGLQLLDESATGCTLVFVPTGLMYQPLSALAVLAGLHGRGFTGICECYIRPDIQDGEYLMGVGLGFEDDAPEDGWWGAFVDDVRDACADDNEVRLERGGCAFATVGELRTAMLHAGTAGFQSGSAVWISDPSGPDPDSPFTGLCRRISGQGN